MSITPLSSLPGSVAGQSSTQQQRQITHKRNAHAAANVGANDTGGQQTYDRDTDGHSASRDHEARQPSDPSGQNGSGLDITA